MAVYYNDSDPAACAWLRELIAAGLLPAGEVDERSIMDVEPADPVFVKAVVVWFRFQAACSAGPAMGPPPPA